MSAGLVVVVALLAWTAISVVVAFLLGAVVARRDRQRPGPVPPRSYRRSRCRGTRSVRAR